MSIFSNKNTYIICHFQNLAFHFKLCNQLLAHVAPFKDPGLLHKVLTEDPAPLPYHCSVGMTGLVLRMLRKDPEQRPGSTDLLRDAIVARDPSAVAR